MQDVILRPFSRRAEGDVGRTFVYTPYNCVYISHMLPYCFYNIHIISTLSKLSVFYVIAHTKFSLNGFFMGYALSSILTWVRMTTARLVLNGISMI